MKPRHRSTWLLAILFLVACDHSVRREWWPTMGAGAYLSTCLNE